MARIETVSWRCWTRTTRPRIVLFVVGRIGVVEIETVGFLEEEKLM